MVLKEFDKCKYEIAKEYLKEKEEEERKEQELKTKVE